METVTARLHGPRVDPRLVDAALALVFVSIGQLDVWLGIEDGNGGTIDDHRPLVALLSLVGLSMLLLRRREPVAGLMVMLAAGIVQVELVEPVALLLGQFVPILLMTYAVAAYAELRIARLALATSIGGVLVIILSVPALRTWDTALFNSLFLAVAWAAGFVVSANRRRSEELTRRAERLERERAETIAGERARLARELHDIVAHSVSVIAVQAEAGEALLDEPERAAEAFRSIQGTSREALVELRRLLGLLRDDGGPLALTPQPGLGDLETLAEQVRAAGLAVELSVEGSARPIDPGVDLSSYRIVQEALTNALRHASAARAQVRVRYLADAIELEIADDGGGAVAAAEAGGHGLIGMRERVALYGGEVAAGPRPTGGFAVRARLPLGAA